jgi:hypothetical protein
METRAAQTPRCKAKARAEGLHFAAIVGLPMLPNRSSYPPRRSPAVAVEVRVPSLGTSFGALASAIRPEGVFLSTFQELTPGTAVIATLSLADGPLEVDGIVVDQGDPAGQGIAVEFEGVDDAMRSRLSAASSIAPPAARVA